MAICILAYLTSSSPIASLLTAAVAWLDGRHCVVIAPVNDSSRIILRHDAESRARTTAQGQQRSSGLVVGVSEKASATADHVVEFDGGSLARRKVPEAPPGLTQPEILDLATIFSWGSDRFSVRVPSFPCRSGVSLAAAVVVAHSVVRLI